MSSVGSFGTFTTARLAIYVSQKGLSVTGNNIANINTVGYTRQRLDQVSFKTGMSDRYQNPTDVHVGNGAIANSVSQLRDPYLDIRYRAEHSSEGFYNGKLEGLNDIADFLDEIGKGDKEGDGLLYAQFSDFYSALQNIQVGAGEQVNDTLAANSAKNLCQLFYNAANQLERLKSNTEALLRQDVNEINDKLVSIRKLNESIQQAEIYGDNALELRDHRNNLIDELSEMLKIDVTYSKVTVGGQEVEKLTIRLGGANPDKDVESDSALLVDGNYCAQLTTPLENLDEDGNSVFIPEYAIFDNKSTAYQNALTEMNNGRPVSNPDAQGQVFHTQKELDDYIEVFTKQSSNKMAAYQYLDPNGEGTNDPRVAKQVFDEHYNITVSDLRDKNDKAWASDPHVRDVYVKDDTGFPTKAKYTGEFTFSGAWKDGDTITAAGRTITIGKDLSADAANEDPKNVSNAIRKAMLDSGQFNDFEISTRTTRSVVNGEDVFNVQLTIKAKDPGAIQGTLPTIDISAKTDANTAPSVSVDTAAVPATNAQGTAIAGQFRAEVKSAGDPNKFHRGDIITIGTGDSAVRLEVGKDLSVNAANDPARLAAKLAGKMKVDGFTVSSTTDTDGKAYLVFRGAQDATAPTVPAVAAEAAKPVEFTGITGGTITNGQPAGNDKNGNPINLTPDPKVVDNGDNTTSKIITRYYMDDNDKWHEVVKTTTTSKTKLLDDNDLFGELQAVRELMTEEGEFASQEDIDRDENAAIKRGIPFYEETLDLLARQFATAMNEANNGFATDEYGNYLTSADGGKTFTQLPDVAGAPLNRTSGLTDDQKAALEADALSNYVKANFAGFVKDADGRDTNVLADRYGKALKLGGKQLSLDMLTFQDTTGAVITAPTADPTSYASVSFTTPADVPDSVKTALNEKALDSYLAVNGGYKMGGNLFSNRGDTDDASGITAKNITVSQSWSSGAVHVVPTYIKLFSGEGTNTTQQDNALHMGNLIHRDMVYNPQDLLDDAVSTNLFNGSFQELLEKMGTTLGSDQDTTKIALETHMGQALDIDTSRDSVSAVDLNDEAMDLMQYTHSLNAAYRLMTTIDEMLERLITGTGVTR